MCRAFFHVLDPCHVRLAAWYGFTVPARAPDGDTGMTVVYFVMVSGPASTMV